MTPEEDRIINGLLAIHELTTTVEGRLERLDYVVTELHEEVKSPVAAMPETIYYCTPGSPDHTPCPGGYRLRRHNSKYEDNPDSLWHPLPTELHYEWTNQDTKKTYEVHNHNQWKSRASIVPPEGGEVAWPQDSEPQPADPGPPQTDDDLPF